MECYNCGQPVPDVPAVAALATARELRPAVPFMPDGSERCPTCGQRFAVAKKTRTNRFAGLGCGSLLLLAVLVGLAASPVSNIEWSQRTRLAG